MFSSAADARAELSTRDAFVSRMSPFDRSARLKTDKPVDEATYLEFAGNQALEWSSQDQKRITAAIKALNAKLLPLHLNFPAEIRFIKTTGLEEGAAAYTRGTAIILPKKMLSRPAPQLQSLVCHELFHILSRHDAELRQRLYRAIGFEPCAELELPESLQKRRITNPDAPIDNHCIKIKTTAIDGKSQEQWAVPILTSTADKYDTARGGEFFDYLIFKLILVDRAAGGANAQKKTMPILADGQPVLIDPHEAGGLMEQIGRNTDYIIHPDEILADNFVILVLGSSKIASPEVLERIRAALAGK
ncbi:MAG: hypothetical protein ACTHK7_17135 [Aureliella sp.]